MSIDVLGSRAGWIALLCSVAVLAGSPAFAEPESAAPAAAASPSAPETNPAPAPSSVGNADATKTEASPSGATVKVIELPSSADKTPEAAKPTEPPKDAAAAPAQEATKPAATAATTPGASDAVLDAVRRKLADKSFAGRQDGDDIAALAAFKSRVPGTPDYIKAANYIEDRYRALGLKNVRHEEFPVTVPVTKTCQITIGGRTMP